jgi:hypothetical protein
LQFFEPPATPAWRALLLESGLVEACFELHCAIDHAARPEAGQRARQVREREEERGETGD